MNDFFAMKVMHSFTDITKVLSNLDFSHFFLFDFIQQSPAFDVLKHDITDFFVKIDVDINELYDFRMG